jgi:hypothetical protein
VRLPRALLAAALLTLAACTSSPPASPGAGEETDTGGGTTAPTPAPAPAFSEFYKTWYWQETSVLDVSSSGTFAIREFVSGVERSPSVFAGQGAFTKVSERLLSISRADGMESRTFLESPTEVTVRSDAKDVYGLPIKLVHTLYATGTPAAHYDLRVINNCYGDFVRASIQVENRVGMNSYIDDTFPGVLAKGRHTVLVRPAYHNVYPWNTVVFHEVDARAGNATLVLCP